MTAETAPLNCHIQNISNIVVPHIKMFYPTYLQLVIMRIMHHTIPSKKNKPQPVSYQKENNCLIESKHIPSNESLWNAELSHLGEEYKS
jgi:branched-subunit amino acid permease